MKYYNTYDYTYGSELDSMLTGILAIYLIILAVMFLFFVISYVFRGIGMYTIAKRQGMDYPWLAFIPFARTYLHGELGGPVKLKKKSIKNPGIWLLALPFIFGAVMFVFYILFWIVGIGAMTNVVSSEMYGYDSYGYGSPFSGGMLMGMIVVLILWAIIAIAYKAVQTVLTVLVNHQIFEKFTSKNMSVAHAVLCTIVPLYESICFFVMRNRNFNPGMEPDFGRPFMQTPPPPVMPGGPIQGPGPGPYGAANMQAQPTIVPPVQEGTVPPVGLDEPMHPKMPESSVPPATPDTPVQPKVPEPSVPPVTPDIPEQPKMPESSLPPVAEENNEIK